MSGSSSSSSSAEEESKRLGRLATAKHPLAVRGMAKASLKVPSGYEITSATVVAVRADACDLRVTLCQGDLCILQKPSFRFSPPLSSSSGSSGSGSGDNNDLEAILDARMTELRIKACAPNPKWLVTDPLALLILTVCFGLAVGTLAVDLVAALEKAPNLESTIGGIFGSTATFAAVVTVSFWFSVVAHLVEAGIAVHYSTSVFGLETVPTATWAFLVFLVGYPVFSRLQELVAIERGHAKSK